MFSKITGKSTFTWLGHVPFELEILGLPLNVVLIASMLVLIISFGYLVNFSVKNCDRASREYALIGRIGSIICSFSVCMFSILFFYESYYFAVFYVPMFATPAYFYLISQSQLDTPNSSLFELLSTVIYCTVSFVSAPCLLVILFQTFPPSLAIHDDILVSRSLSYFSTFPLYFTFFNYLILTTWKLWTAKKLYIYDGCDAIGYLVKKADTWVRYDISKDLSMDQKLLKP